MADSYSLHRLVWANDPAQLRHLLNTRPHNLEELDPQKRTPLRLAVALDRFECGKVLIEFGADACVVDSEGWSAVHDATSTGDARLLRLILEQRNKAQRNEAQDRIPQLLSLLETSGDFYVEMSWDFSSWVPLVSRMCPSDVYRIWKRGSNVRVDTTLLGYSNLKWIRGHRSFIFRCREREGVATEFEMVQVDHDRKVALAQSVVGMNTSSSQVVTDEELRERLNAPIAVTMMDSNAIGFSRARSGIWGFQSDKSDTVNGYVAKVFNVSGIEVVTKTRYEHLPRDHPARRKGKSALSQMMSGVMGSSAEGEDAAILMSEEESTTDEAPKSTTTAAAASGVCASSDEYFKAGGAAPLAVGRPREIREHRQHFKAQLWMADDFPLSLQRQVLPIVDLMAPTSQHIAKLRDFISLQLPTGFPVKIEIPVYHLVNARVTFASCKSEVDPAVFEVPSDYATVQPDSTDVDEDVIFARALQYSMAEQPDMDDDEIMRRVLALSLAESQGVAPAALPPALAAAAPSRAGASWACEVCTFANTTAGAECEMCGTPRSLPTPTPHSHSHRHGHGHGHGPAPGAMEDIMLQQAIAQSMAADDDAELRRAIERSLSEK